jgi:ribosomal protein L16 Arg81 hydroxylase
MISLDTKSEIIQLRGLDYSYDAISAKVGISKPKVMEICSEFDAEISTVRKSQLNATVEDLSYATNQRSDLYRQLVSKLYAEISSRDITEVSTERLFTMLERTERSLSAIEQRTMPTASDPFADMSDEDIEKILSVSKH